MDFKKILLFFILLFKLPAFGIVELDFWDGFEDGNLNYFITRGIEANIDIKTAKLNSEIYKNYIGYTNADRLPNLQYGLTPEFLKQEGKKSYDWNFTAPIQVNYEADIFLKNRDKTNLSKKDYEISLLDEKAAKISITSMIGSVYFNILKLDKTIELQEKITDLRNEIYELNKIGNKNGQISIQDTLIANKSCKQSEAELEELKKIRKQLVYNLAVLVGTSPNETEDFTRSNLDDIEYKGIIPENIQSVEITARPDYQIAEKNVEKAGIDIKIAKKEFLPSINLTGLMTFNSGDFSIFNAKSILLGIGTSIAGDLFSGGRKMSNLKIKKSNYEIALKNYEKTNLTAIQEVNDALAAIKHDKIKLDKTKEQNELEKKDYAVYQGRFDKGVIGKLDLLYAKENLLNAKKLVLEDKTNCFIDYISLYKALGAKMPLKS